MQERESDEGGGSDASDRRPVGADVAWALIAVPMALLAQAAFVSRDGLWIALSLVAALAGWTIATACGDRGVARRAGRWVAVVGRRGRALSSAHRLRHLSLGAVVLSGQGVACHLAVSGGADTVAAAAWAVSIAAFVLSIEREPRRRRVARTEGRRWAAAALCLTLLGLAVRLYRLDTYPTGMHGDEGSFSSSALALLNGADLELFGAQLFHAHPNLFAYLQAAAMAVFGSEVAAARLPAAVAGGLTVTAVGLLGRSAFGGRVGLFAMALLAVQPWHLKMSRMALNDVLVPLFLVLTLWLLVRGLRGGRVFDFAMAGIAAGFGMWIDHHSKSVLLAVIVAAVLLYLVVWHRDALLPHAAKKLALFAVAAVLVLLPFWANSAHRGQLIEFRHTAGARNFRANLSDLRDAYQTDSTARILVGQMQRAVFAFNHFGDRSGFRIGGGRPVFNSPSGVLFLVGAAFAIWHWRRLGTGLLACWWVVGLVPDVVGVYAPTAHHLLPVIPAAALIAALGLERIWRLTTALLGPQPVGMAAVAALLLATSAAIDVDWFFSPATNHRDWQIHTEAGVLLRSLQPHHDLLFLGPPDVASDYGSIQFASHDAHVIDVHDVDTVMMPLQRAERQTVVVVTPGHFLDVALLARAVPGGVVQRRFDESRNAYLVWFMVPAAGSGLVCGEA